MSAEHVGDTTIEELKELINQLLDERGLKVAHRSRDGRSVREILDSIERHRFTPPPGSKSSLEMLREDRDA
jgi:hypothetical protein